MHANFYHFLVSMSSAEWVPQCLEWILFCANLWNEKHNADSWLLPPLAKCCYKKTTGYKQKPFHCCNYQGCSNGYLYWYLRYLSAVVLSTVFKYWYWYTKLGYWYLYWYSRLKYWDLYWYWRLRYGYWYVYLVRVASSWNHTVHDCQTHCSPNLIVLKCNNCANRQRRVTVCEFRTFVNYDSFRL